jgi:hypothetical protein
MTDVIQTAFRLLQSWCGLATVLLLASPTWALANCMSSDRTYWQDNTKLPAYARLMQLMACQGGATAIEATQLNDTSACNWFLSRALEKLYGIRDFVPVHADEWLSANAIHDYVATHPDTWRRLGNAEDQQILAEAAAGAANGQPVIAVKRGTPSGHVALVLPGPLTPSAQWKLRVPNSASFFLNNQRVVEKAYVGCKLSYAFSGPEGVELFWRLKKK